MLVLLPQQKKRVFICQKQIHFISLSSEQTVKLTEREIMKQTVFNIMASVFCTLLFPVCANAASNNTDMPAETVVPAGETIQLKEPDKTLNVSLMQALSDRKSQREFSEKPISLETLSSMLWAANGVNRADGRRTAPSAVNAQDIDIFVCMANGAYLYDAKQHQLKRVTTEDVRPQVAGRQPMAAPVFLVLVGDVSRYPGGMAQQRQVVESLSAMDAGYVSQNICLYCAAAKLATVPRASMNKEALAKSLNLKETQVLLLNNPVGYAK
jgi:nitroreductase